jgi:hypothetical protein
MSKFLFEIVSSSYVNPNRLSEIPSNKSTEIITLNQELILKKKEIKAKIKTFKKTSEFFKEISSYVKTKEISESFSLLIDSSTDLFTKQENFKKYQIFRYNKVPWPSTDKNDYIKYFRLFLSSNSELALSREKQKIENLKNCCFFGSIVSCVQIVGGVCNNKFKVISGKPRKLIAIGIGNSVGINSNLFFISLEIIENDQKVLEVEPNIEICNKYSRLTTEFVLSQDIWIKSGIIYNFEFKYLGKAYYSLGMNESFIEFEDLRIEIIEKESTSGMTFYLRLGF